ncbi:MAG: metalloregulator ArsR/SmtB family transcription factor [Gemmatimonadota bacterium]
MLQRLARGEASVSELGTPHRLTLPGVLKHVRYLESAGLVTARKEGRTRMCRLAPLPLASAAEWLSTYRAFWEGQLESLARLLNQPPTAGARAWQAPLPPRTSKSGVRSTPPPSGSSPRGRKPKR